MKTVNSISGGKTSAFISVHYPADYEIFSLVTIDDINSKPKDKSIVDYVNYKLEKYTSEYGEFIATAEDDKTLYVMRDLEQIIGKEIIWIRGKSFDNIIDDGTHTRLPSWARRYCTTQMKLLPIFQWWFNNIGEVCEMRIGFRFDEFKRMERFFNYSNPANFKIPISTKTYGNKRQQHQEYNWRYCSFPLIQNGITRDHIDDYWATKGYIESTLFYEGRQIEFPVISNCIGCFHKNPETLAVMCKLHPSKMQWFSEQETKEMGTWLDSRLPYKQIINNYENIAKEVLYEIEVLNQSCDSGGCTA